MLFKWVLIFFFAFMNPPRPGRPQPALLGRVQRTLTWTVLVPAVAALLLLAVTLLRQPP